MKNFKLRILLWGAVFLWLGVLRFEMALPRVNENFIGFYNGQSVELQGQISNEPDVRETHQKITVGNIKINSRDRSGPVHGKILINTFKSMNLEYGDEVELKCRIQEPGVIESEDRGPDFDYGRYLSVKGIYSVCYSADSIQKIDGDKYFAQKIYGDFLGLKQKFKRVIDSVLPLPSSGVLNAMLLGYRQELTDEMSNSFSQVGLSHIVAISGLHITILAGILFYLFILCGVPRQKSFWPAVIILFLYVALIGFRPSAVRALIMGGLVLYALKIGRLAKALNALVLAAVVLLIINPKLLMFDVGFQLSFLAVLGILYFYPLLNKKTIKQKNNKAKFFNTSLGQAIKSILLVTVAAQILTLPLVFYYFRVISLVAPLANLLVLPILPIIMVGGLLLILIGLISVKLALVPGIMVWVLISYVLKVVDVLGQIPWGHFTF